MNPPASPAPSSHPGTIPAVIMAVCAAVIAVMLLSSSWTSATSRGKETVSAGPFSVEGCQRARCEPLPWDMVNHEFKLPDDVNALRYLALLAGLGALGLLAEAAYKCWNRRAAAVKVKPALIACGVAALAFLAFSLRMSSVDGEFDFGVSWATFVAVAAVGIGAAILHLRVRPLQTQPMA